jgi:hypothetical protein
VYSPESVLSFIGRYYMHDKLSGSRTDEVRLVDSGFKCKTVSDEYITVNT